MKRTGTTTIVAHTPAWHLVDLSDQVLGRAASRIAAFLIGKERVGYSPYLDQGDYVVAINASKIALTGKKRVQKSYRWHTNFPKGFRERSFGEVLDKYPDRVVSHAVSNMLPKNKLRPRRLLRLKIFPGSEHPYQDKIRGAS